MRSPLDSVTMPHHSSEKSHYETTPPPEILLSMARHRRSLPHPQRHKAHVEVSHHQTPPPSAPRDAPMDGRGGTSSDGSPRRLKHASRSIGGRNLPPTPSHSRQSSFSQAPSIVTPAADVNHKSQSSFHSTMAPRTPPHQLAPLTPELTPPHESLKPAPPRHMLSSGCASSRTDSFKTALESQESSDEEEEHCALNLRSILPHATLPADPVMAASHTAEPVGPSSKSGAEERAIYNDVFFDGGNPKGRKIGPMRHDNFVRNVNSSKTRENTSTVRSETDRQGLVPTDAQNSSGTLTIPADSKVASARRIAVMSKQSRNSAVVEAFIVEDSLARPRALKHRKNFARLAAEAEHATPIIAQHEPVPPAVEAHRLLRSSKVRNLRHLSAGSVSISGDLEKGRSLERDAVSGEQPMTPATTLEHIHDHLLPATRPKPSVTISAADPSDATRHSHGISRPPVTRLRHRSDNLVSLSERTMDYPPIVPIRSSSLSAPTSRNPSRTCSLTAESLLEHEKHHQLALAKLSQLETDAAAAHDDHDSEARSPDIISPDQRGPPSQISCNTPGTAAEFAEALIMSLYSHRNSSLLVVQHPGYDSSAATSTPRTSTFRAEPSSLTDDTAHSDTDRPVTPENKVSDLVEHESPFQNPRAPPQPPQPPQPPVLVFIPPTPAAQDPVVIEARQARAAHAPVANEKPRRSSSLIRTFSRHTPRPELINMNVSLLRRFSLKKRKPPTTASVATQTSRPTAQLEPLVPTVSDSRPADGSRLHPFWRPARFWDDLEDYESSSSDDEEGGHHYGAGVGPYGTYPYIDNRPQPPKRSLSGRLKRTFAILPLQDFESSRSRPERRTIQRSHSGTLKVVPYTHAASDSMRVARDRMASAGPRDRPRGNIVAGWEGLRRRFSGRSTGTGSQKRRTITRDMISTPKEFVNGGYEHGRTKVDRTTMR